MRKNKILLIIFCAITVSVLFMVTCISSFAYDNSYASDYMADIPDMNCLYYVEGQTTPGRFAVYGRSRGVSASASYSNSADIISGGGSTTLQYRSFLHYKAETYIDFTFLPITTSNIAIGDQVVYWSSDNTLRINTTAYNLSSNHTGYESTIYIEYFDSDLRLHTAEFNIGVGEYPLGLLFDDYNHNGLNNLFAIKSILVQFDYSDSGQNAYCQANITIDTKDQFVSNMEHSVTYLRNIAQSLGVSGDIADQIYNSGYDTGYGAGYNIGVGEGYNNGYDTGYESGYTQGEGDGYTIGVNDGIEIGYDDGFTVGEEQGYVYGFDDGYDEGFNVGEEQGYNTGYLTGYDNGFLDGQNNILENTGIFEFIVKSFKSIFEMPLGEHFTLGGLLSIVLGVPVLLFIFKLLRG